MSVLNPRLVELHHEYTAIRDRLRTLRDQLARFEARERQLLQEMAFILPVDQPCRIGSTIITRTPSGTVVEGIPF